jgi:hypothetical protein
VPNAFQFGDHLPCPSSGFQCSAVASNFAPSSRVSTLGATNQLLGGELEQRCLDALAEHRLDTESRDSSRGHASSGSRHRALAIFEHRGSFGRLRSAPGDCAGSAKS